MITQHKFSLPRAARARRQDGAALVVGMILLMVLTLLAISGMNSATLELQMAGNAQYSENAFQAAETGVEVALREARLNGTNTANVDPEKTELVTGTTDHYKIITLHDPDNGVTKVPSGGFSMGVGKGFSAYHFDVTSTGTSSRSSTQTHVQGFYVVAQAAK
ncbi:MAG TPA: PilX N-terminal domain-containing pilus assembly protein [Steroidobacteraceae bacterium]|jgi:type IV pilus assembly protein PilX|nr:PilX N-terminal domain-containing pilus assembly protein [Steroidobacteraceae bacterium]